MFSILSLVKKRLVSANWALLLLAPLILLSGCGRNKASYLPLDRQPNQKNKEKTYDFLFTNDEKSSLSQWATKSMDNLSEDAHKGNPPALYMVGMCMLTGQGGWPIVPLLAETYFALSGSFGFAPALHQLHKIYLYDYSNPFLSMVYLNLTICSGHPELCILYQDFKNKMTNQYGKRIFNEIEKIAIHKKHLIKKFHSNLKKHPKSWMVHGEAITDEDVIFDSAFWMAIYSGLISTGNIEEWLTNSDIYSLKIERLAEQTRVREQKIQEISRE